MPIDHLLKTAREIAPEQSGVITANLGVYRVIDDAVVFALLEIEGNPLFDERFHKATYAHILREKVTRVDCVMKEHLIAALDTKKAVEVRYFNVRLKWEAGNFYYIESDGENTSAEEMLLEGVFGTTNRGSGRRVYLLPEFEVKHKLKQYPGDILICGCYAENGYFFAQGHASTALKFSVVLDVLEDR